jgi:hypothetical protein
VSGFRNPARAASLPGAGFSSSSAAVCKVSPALGGRGRYHHENRKQKHGRETTREVAWPALCQSSPRRNSQEEPSQILLLHSSVRVPDTLIACVSEPWREPHGQLCVSSDVRCVDGPKVTVCLLRVIQKKFGEARTAASIDR